MSKPKLLDLFAGAGGAARGYQQAGFHVTGIDIVRQPRYIGDAFIQMDAIAAMDTLNAGGYIVDTAEHKWYLKDFDAIHASPPCQAYTGMRRITIARFGSAPDHPDLIEPTRRSLEENGKPWVIENVQNSPLHTQVILCGAAFGLKHVARHRHFESSVMLWNPPRCCHHQEKYTVGVYGERPDGRRVSQRQYRLCRVARSLEEAQQLMGIDWMIWDEIKQAIPPAYTKWVGERLLEAMGTGEPVEESST
jgi:DNA (cytosine-5)-methyltransferase 1